MKTQNIANSTTYVMVGSGEPPMLLQVSSIGLSSVATAMEPGEITGGCGGVRTVKLWNSWCTSAPVPLALMRHSKRPLSRLYETFLICRSYMPRSGWKSSLQKSQRKYMTFYRRFFTDFLNANRYVFPAHSLPLNFSFILFDFPHASHHSPPPLEPHITNCANIGFSVGYPVAAAAAVGAALRFKDPQVVQL